MKEEKEVSLLVGKAIMVYEEKGEKIKKEEERWVSLFQYEADKDCKPGKI